MQSTELWAQCLAFPGDEQHKALYVEALVEEGDRRAEAFLVAAEIRRFQDQGDSLRASKLASQYEALLMEARAGFTAVAGKWKATIAFVQGWPTELTLKASDFALHSAEICATLPLRHLNLSFVKDTPEVFEVPQFNQIVSLRANAQPWSNKTLMALTASPYLRSLRCLDLSKIGLTEKQVEMLAAAQNLREVAQIDLSRNPCRDPVDASLGCGYDGISGHIVAESIFLPEFGRELQSRHGTIGWLHVLSRYGTFPLSRYRF